MLSDIDRQLEQALLSEISPQQLWKHAAALAQWQRLSGTADEVKAAEYIKSALESYGVKVNTYHFESLLGYPGPASLSVLAPEPRTIECITHPFAAPTPEQGLEGELVYVSAGNAADYRGHDVDGKIVLVEGLAAPFKARLAEELGAKAEIFINDDNLHEMCLSPVWGTPTSSSARKLPQKSCISIGREGGRYLRELLLRRPVRVHIEANPRLEWKKVPLVVAEIKGTVESDEFVMFSGHLCSWYYGALDNAGANGAMIEIGRVLQQHHRQLRRSLRLAFWPGHSQGRYSGSTWYADNFWEDVYHHCVLHVNIDCVGAKGAQFYEAYCMAETRDFAVNVIQEITGKSASPKRMTRAGDQSFWGSGVPSMFMTLSIVPPEMMTEVADAVIRGGEGTMAASQGGLPWFWHTAADTLDKLDIDVLTLDTKVYLVATFRACNSSILPFDYLQTAEEFVEVLSELQRKAGSAFDLASLLARAEQFKASAAKLSAAVDSVESMLATGKQVPKEVVTKLNRCLKKLGRSLIPVNYTYSGEFEHDLAIPIPPMPGLQAVVQLAELDPKGDSFRFLRTELLRQGNRVAHALALATEAIAEAL